MPINCEPAFPGTSPRTAVLRGHERDGPGGIVHRPHAPLSLTKASVFAVLRGCAPQTLFVAVLLSLLLLPFLSSRESHVRTVPPGPRGKSTWTWKGPRDPWARRGFRALGYSQTQTAPWSELQFPTGPDPLAHGPRVCPVSHVYYLQHRLPETGLRSPEKGEETSAQCHS